MCVRVCVCMCVCACVCVRACLCACVRACSRVIVKRHALPPCVADGRYRNPLLLLLLVVVASVVNPYPTVPTHRKSYLRCRRKGWNTYRSWPFQVTWIHAIRCLLLYYQRSQYNNTCFSYIRSLSLPGRWRHLCFVLSPPYSVGELVDWWAGRIRHKKPKASTVTEVLMPVKPWYWKRPAFNSFGQNPDLVTKDAITFPTPHRNRY